MIPQLLAKPDRTETAEEPPDQDYWLSYSDLLAGLLMVFTLMLLAALYSYQSGVDGVREILAVRQDVVETLRQEFQEGETRLVEVQDDGTIRFAEDVLFGFDAATLAPANEEIVRTFARQYLGVLFENPRFNAFRDEISSIVVEGHTDDSGPYVYNLDLSQRRASSVMTVLLGEVDPRHEFRLQRLITASGRSYAEPICLDGAVDQSSPADVGASDRCAAQGGIDRNKSRRIEIRFELKDRALLERLLDLLDDAA